MIDCLGNCVTCLKVNHSLFDELSTKELEVLNLYRTRTIIKKGEFLYREGDVMPGLICLNTGKVKLVKQGEIENEFIVSLHKTVDFVGFDDLMSNQLCSTSAIALEDVAVCTIMKEQFLKVIEQNASLALKIIKFQAEQLIDKQNRLINIAQKNLDARLAYTLLHLSDFFCDSKNQQVSIHTFKRRELAALSSMNTANAIRTLTKFKQKGWISIEKKAIIVLDKTQLLSLL